MDRPLNIKDEIRQKGMEIYKAESKARLLRIIKKRIQTTMIGALASIEAHFGSLWENDSSMRSLYETLREEILDKGNDQIRGINDELKQYDVEWLRYRITLPVRKPGLREDQDE